MSAVDLMSAPGNEDHDFQVLGYSRDGHVIYISLECLATKESSAYRSNPFKKLQKK